jgi:hypothetical protein
MVTEKTVYTARDATEFTLYNAGDVTIDPRNSPLVITYLGASDGLTIRNVTTGDEWTYEGATVAGDVIQLDGVRSTKNSVSIFRDTNHRLITLEPGANDFELAGTDGSFEITFDFRFRTL